MDYVREDLQEKNIQKLPGLVKRPKTNKKEVWKSLVRASSSAQPTEEKKEGRGWLSESIKSINENVQIYSEQIPCRKTLCLKTSFLDHIYALLCACVCTRVRVQECVHRSLCLYACVLVFVFVCS